MRTLLEHFDVVQVALLGLIMVLGYFIRRTFSEIHENMGKMGEILQKLSDEFHILQGEHNVLKDTHNAQVKCSVAK